MVGLLGMLPRPICSGTSAWRPLTSRCLVGQPSLPLWKRMYAARPEKLETNAQEEETMEMATDKSGKFFASCRDDRPGQF